MSPAPGDQKGWRPIRNIDRFLKAKGDYFVVTITKSEENLPIHKLVGDCFSYKHWLPIHC